jgi:hypothetical protein
MSLVDIDAVAWHGRVNGAVLISGGRASAGVVLDLRLRSNASSILCT